MKANTESIPFEDVSAVVISLYPNRGGVASGHIGVRFASGKPALEMDLGAALPFQQFTRSPRDIIRLLDMAKSWLARGFRRAKAEAEALETIRLNALRVTLFVADRPTRDGFRYSAQALRNMAEREPERFFFNEGTGELIWKGV